MYLWLKAVHILFVMSWMAGIFYLPRIFVHFVEGKEAGQDVDRLVIMARKLYGFMSIMMVIAIVSGVMIWVMYGFNGMWLNVKLVFVGLMIVYHVWCKKRMKEMQEGHLDKSGVFYRWMNELPLVILSVILIMVVVKPF